MPETDGWRRLIAVLANAEARTIAARMMLGDDLESATSELSASKQRRLRAALLKSGLVDPHTHAFDEGVFRAVLDATPVVKKEGIERFVDGRRIRQYPKNLIERGALLRWVAETAFSVGEVLSEAEVNERLAPFSEDVAVLRRYLVDYQLVERRSDGSEYAPTGAAPVVGVG